MAETNSLLNCRRGNPTGGSNPPLSAEHEGPFGVLFFDYALWKNLDFLNDKIISRH